MCFFFASWLWVVHRIGETTYLSLSSTDCPSSALTADAFVGPSTEAESGSVTAADITFAGFDAPPAVELFTFAAVALPTLVTGAPDVLTAFVVFGAGPAAIAIKMDNQN